MQLTINLLILLLKRIFETDIPLNFFPTQVRRDLEVFLQFILVLDQNSTV